MEQIYCVKIHQLRLPSNLAVKKSHPFDYFPFDRIYLVPKTKRKLALALFPYSLITTLSQDLYDALRTVSFEYRRNIDIPRTASLEYQELAHNQIPPEIKSLTPHKWLIVIPTFVIPQYKKSGAPKKLTPKLAYTLTQVIGRLHNLKVTFPAIALHTPHRDVPAICAICKHMPRYYANECSPGQFKCKSTMELTIPLEKIQGGADDNRV